MKAGQTNERGLWAEADVESRRGKAPCGPYDCRELLAWLAAHAEHDGPLIRNFIASQQGVSRAGADHAAE